MDISKKLSEIIISLDNALIDMDWECVSECVEELNYLNEDIQSSFPYEYGDFESESDF
jgi:hypothetical protein